MNNSQEDLRGLGLVLARLIAGLAVDPHGYFEKKYTARIESADSDVEISHVLAQLLQWAGSPEITEIEREKLDRELSDRGLPTVDDLCVKYVP
jgi:hypothetical protein